MLTGIRADRPRRRPSAPRGVEVLEPRELLTTFTVTNLLAVGAGSLRQAIVGANGQPGPSTIDFAVTGTIHTGKAPLPAIASPVNIDGASAPGFVGTPVVTLDFVGARGLRFATGSAGSTLTSMAIVRAGGAGVTIAATDVNVQGNFIGLLANGQTVAGNRGAGILIEATSHGDLIGTIDGTGTSNVISGNRGDGIAIVGASNNQIAMNAIGTNAIGTLRLGNGGDGIRIARGASGNMIGGQASGGNDPTAGVIVRPPQGNLISGNRGDGVLINGGATGNTLSGNFVGTTDSGDVALGNRGDGVAIVRANGNQLIGCTVQDQPFVYYNVVGGNGGNGLRITNSNDTTVQANFLGTAADNAVIVANHRDGLLVSGTSSDTQVGGVIPLGNVISGNDRNGIEVAQAASGFISFNTFGGTYAFGGAAPNRGDGIKITASGGNNVVRTSIISGNLGNGIEIGGRATGVQVTDTAAGTNSSIQSAIPNGGDGIKIDGRAQGIVIGGYQPSIEPQVTVSANQGDGISVAGHARDVAIFHTQIGTNAMGTAALSNGKSGIDLGPGTSGTTIGGASASLAVNVLDSLGPGLSIRSSRANTVLGVAIRGNTGPGVLIAGNSAGTRVQDSSIGGNAGNGVAMIRARGVAIGGAPATGEPTATGTSNRIVANSGYGVLALGGCRGSAVQGNTIADNARGNVNLTLARGIIYVP